MSRPTVWILVHDLSLSGVPVMLERLLEGTDPARRSRVHVIALRGGPLRERLGRLCASVTVLEPVTGRTLLGAAGAGLRVVGSGDRAAPTRLARRVDATAGRLRTKSLPKPDVVVVHGAGAWPLIAAAPSGVPVVLHLHELETALDRCIPAVDRLEVFRRVRRVMVVSGPVADLARRSGAARDVIVRVPGVVAPGPVNAAAHGILPEGRRWVLGAGQPGWRKGTDRLAPLAWELGRRVPDAAVGWVGGRPSGPDAEWVEGEDPVRWFEERADPWSVMAAAEVVVIPSREDPLPLVALEAGQHCRPVVATPTGGLPDLLAEGRGLVAAGHDLRELCDRLEQVLRSPDLALELGAALAVHVAQHHRVEVVAQTWWQVLEQSASE